MATYSDARSVHHTLAASTTDTVTLTGAWRQVMVTNRSGSAEIYVTVDGTTPTVGGNSTYVLPAAVGSRVFTISATPLNPRGNATASSVTTLISSGTPTYSVEGIL